MTDKKKKEVIEGAIKYLPKEEFICNSFKYSISDIYDVSYDEAGEFIDTDFPEITKFVNEHGKLTTINWEIENSFEDMMAWNFDTLEFKGYGKTDTFEYKLRILKEFLHTFSEYK